VKETPAVHAIDHGRPMDTTRPVRTNGRLDCVLQHDVAGSARIAAAQRRTNEVVGNFAELAMSTCTRVIGLIQCRYARVIRRTGCPEGHWRELQQRGHGHYAEQMMIDEGFQPAIPSTYRSRQRADALAPHVRS